MSCVTSSGCRLGSQIIGSLITLKIHLCNCILKFCEAFINDSFLNYVLHMPFVGCWILCIRCADILFFMFCGPGQHSGYSDYLSASLPGIVAFTTHPCLALRLKKV